jgi:hypothetical protein
MSTPRENSLPAFTDTLVAVEEQVLELYRRHAHEQARAAAAESAAREARDSLTRSFHRTISELAAERFAFDRLIGRILPMLESAGLEQAVKVIQLYARSWDANLKRARIEVADLAGQPLTDELAEVIEVESAISDPAVREIVVRETLSPLVKLEGRVIGLARVNTSVPVHSDGT